MDLQEKIDILALKRLKIFNEKNEAIYLSELWQNKPVVIIFVRHFGCISSRSHIDLVWANREQIRKSGSGIVFIGSADPQVIPEFKKEFNLVDVPIYTDPTLETFKATGLIHTDTKNLDAKSLKMIKELELKGYTLKIIQNDGDDTQLGGVIAIKPPGLVTYHFISKFIGDFDQENLDKY